MKRYIYQTLCVTLFVGLLSIYLLTGNDFVKELTAASFGMVSMALGDGLRRASQYFEASLKKEKAADAAVSIKKET